MPTSTAHLLKFKRSELIAEVQRLERDLARAVQAIPAPRTPPWNLAPTSPWWAFWRKK